MNKKELDEYIYKKLDQNILENTILFYGEDKDLFKENIVNFALKILGINFFSLEKIKELKTKPIKDLKISENFWKFIEEYDENSEEQEKKQIKIGEVQEFFEDIIYKGQKNKVYILDEADLLNINAQNSILKIIEEPPKGVYIFLIAKGLESILSTIKSRCTKIYLAENIDLKKDLQKEIKNKNLEKFENIYLDAMNLNKLQYIAKYNKLIEKKDINQILDNLDKLFVYSLEKDERIAPSNKVILSLNKKRTQNVNSNILKTELIIGIYNYINLYNKKNLKNNFQKQDIKSKIQKEMNAKKININKFEDIVYK